MLPEKMSSLADKIKAKAEAEKAVNEVMEVFRRGR